MMFSTAAGSRTSHPAHPLAATTDAFRSAASGSTSAKNTAAPDAVTPSARAEPIPPPPPVIRMYRPLRRSSAMGRSPFLPQPTRQMGGGSCSVEYGEESGRSALATLHLEEGPEEQESLANRQFGQVRQRLHEDGPGFCDNVVEYQQDSPADPP